MFVKNRDIKLLGCLYDVTRMISLLSVMPSGISTELFFIGNANCVPPPIFHGVAPRAFKDILLRIRTSSIHRCGHACLNRHCGRVILDFPSFLPFNVLDFFPLTQVVYGESPQVLPTSLLTERACSVRRPPWFLSR